MTLLRGGSRSVLSSPSFSSPRSPSHLYPQPAGRSFALASQSPTLARQSRASISSALRQGAGSAVARPPPLRARRQQATSLAAGSPPGSHLAPSQGLPPSAHYGDPGRQPQRRLRSCQAAGLGLPSGSESARTRFPGCRSCVDRVPQRVLAGSAHRSEPHGVGAK